MNVNANCKRFKVSRWIVFSIAILVNVFIVVYSCLSGPATKVMARPFNDFFTNLVNMFTHKDIEVINLEKIDISLSNEESYVYNYIPGYKVNEIPLGSAKQIECSFSPIDATDKAISYSAYPSDMVILNQSGSLLSVVGMKTGKCLISAKSNDGGFQSSVEVKIVDTVAPTSFEISLDSYELAIGSPKSIEFDIDGGPLTHDELINFRYYDTRKLEYASLDNSVAEVDEYGVIYPKSVGTTTIKVSNDEITKSFDISVVSGSIPSKYENLTITGSNVCYGNDMIQDQSSHKNHYQLTPMDGNIELNPEDFIWKSSNELLVKVDRHGVMRGFRKSIIEDEHTTIKAISKLTGQEASFEVTVKNQLPTKMDVLFRNDANDTWNPITYTAMVGDVVYLRASYSPSTQVKGIDVSSSDNDVVSITNEGPTAVLHVNSVGSSNIRITSIANPNLVFEINVTVVKAGAIDINNIEQFTSYIRKSLGHAFVFMLAQIFTYLTLYMFLYEKKWWFYSSISLGEGLLLAGLSELIQFFIPTRGGAWLDILIDFSGVLVGAILTFLVILLIEKIKAKKKNIQKID